MYNVLRFCCVLQGSGAEEVIDESEDYARAQCLYISVEGVADNTPDHRCDTHSESTRQHYHDDTARKVEFHQVDGFFGPV